jgi:hypothetical protein
LQGEKEECVPLRLAAGLEEVSGRIGRGKRGRKMYLQIRKYIFKYFLGGGERGDGKGFVINKKRH